MRIEFGEEDPLKLVPFITELHNPFVSTIDLSQPCTKTHEDGDHDWAVCSLILRLTLHSESRPKLNSNQAIPLGAKVEISHKGFALGGVKAAFVQSPCLGMTP
jgi:hypothetical protein